MLLLPNPTELGHVTKLLDFCMDLILVSFYYCTETKKLHKSSSYRAKKVAPCSRFIRLHLGQCWAQWVLTPFDFNMFIDITAI